MDFFIHLLIFYLIMSNKLLLLKKNILFVFCSEICYTLPSDEVVSLSFLEACSSSSAVIGDSKKREKIQIPNTITTFEAAIDIYPKATEIFQNPKTNKSRTNEMRW